jgi:hypothetical protein
MRTELSPRPDSTSSSPAFLSLSLADGDRVFALRDYLLRLGASAEIRADLTIGTSWEAEDDLTAFVQSWAETNGVHVELRSEHPL